MNIVFKILVFSLIAFVFSYGNIVFANTDPAQGTVLPYGIEEKSVNECKSSLLELFNMKDPSKHITDNWDDQGNTLLACGIKTGQMKLWMVPFYIRFMLEFVIQISGLAHVCPFGLPNLVSFLGLFPQGYSQ